MLRVADAGDVQAVRVLVQEHCVACHGPDTQEGDVRFDKLTGSPQEELVWASILEQLVKDAMPPKDEPRLSGEEHSVFTTWIERKFPKAAQALAEKMQRPENGNLVPHDKLFDPKVAEQAPKIAASPARVWRTLPQSYEQKQEAWLNARGVRVAMRVGQDKKYGYLPAPFGLRTGAELKNYSFGYSLAGSQTEGLANNARSLLDLVIKAKPGPRHKKLIREVALAKEPPSPADVDQIVVEQYRHWLGRDPEALELEQRRKKILDSIRKFGNRDGLIYGLVPVMIDHEVFFHTEIGNVHTSSEPAFLSPQELIDAMDRALRDRRNHADRRGGQWEIGYGKPIVRDFLVVAAKNGKLNSREDLIAALDKALSHEHVPQLSQSETVK